MAGGAARFSGGGKRLAFTLAEVLITLGIIGVVAAMTLPTLIQKHQKLVLSNALKKSVNTLENASRLAIAQNEAATFKDTDLYAAIAEGSYSCRVDATVNCDNFDKVVSKYFKQVKIMADTASLGQLPLEASYAMFLTDGSIIYWDVHVASYTAFAIDTNGLKGPNKELQDFFMFWYDENGKLVPGFEGYKDIVNNNYKIP